MRRRESQRDSQTERKREKNNYRDRHNENLDFTTVDSVVDDEVENLNYEMSSGRFEMPPTLYAAEKKTVWSSV